MQGTAEAYNADNEQCIPMPVPARTVHTSRQPSSLKDIRIWMKLVFGAGSAPLDEEGGVVARRQVHFARHHVRDYHHLPQMLQSGFRVYPSRARSPPPPPDAAPSSAVVLQSGLPIIMHASTSQ